MSKPDGTWARLLLVDDEPANVVLLERLLETWGYTGVTSTTSSTAVPELCAANAFDLILLDLHMPKMDGFEVMEAIRPVTETHPQIPVLVLTADVTQPTRQRALASGASDFLSKPLDPTEVRLRIANLLETRRLQLYMLDQNRRLEGRVAERTSDLERARVEVLERLALAAEYRDDDTQEHAQRVGRAVAAVASLLGMHPEDVEVQRRAAPLHDIGKIGIPDSILLKPGTLTDEEFALMKTHTTIGAEILSGSEFPILRAAEEIARTHHERWDGSGYPAGLTEERIPLPGRIVAVVDVFDALVHERPYKPAWPIERALAEIERLAGRHFDRKVVAAFLSLDHRSLLGPIEAQEPVGLVAETAARA